MSYRKRSYSKSRSKPVSGKRRYKSYRKYSKSSRRIGGRGSIGAVIGRPIPGAEYKNLDTVLDVQLVPLMTPNAGAMSGQELVTDVGAFLNGVPIGPNPVNRIGARTTGISLRLQGRLVYCDGDFVNFALAPVRMAVVYDKAPRDTSIPCWQDVFASTDASMTIASNLYSLPNPSNRDRFVILSDEVWLQEIREPTGGIPSNNTGLYATNLGLQPKNNEFSNWIDRYIKLRNMETVWRNNALSVVQYITGSIFLIPFCPTALKQAVAVGGNNYRFKFVGTCRYTYQDA